ncbi:MAG: esterase [Bacteroidetes bacterium]|nr:esterase [Bacteroidota bacterium]
MRVLLAIVQVFLFSVPVLGQLPVPSAGRIERIDSFRSKYVTPRNVDVWLPEGYDPAKKYAVLYMHDGQMLFDSTLTWNKQCWQVDETMTALIKAKKIPTTIVVGIWNGGVTRHPDYFPQKPFDGLSQPEKDKINKDLQEKGRTTEIFQPRSDNYLRFLVEELKPLIDKRYSTYQDAEHTAIAGSSMGGLISLYAICEYPNVFGRAAGLSTHWPGIFSVDGNPFIPAHLTYLQKNLPDSKTHRIYLDGGNQELDALYPPLLMNVEKVLREKGYADKNGRAIIIKGTGHSERAWSSRLHEIITYLLLK